jgi:hypothetical protein
MLAASLVAAALVGCQGSTVAGLDASPADTQGGADASPADTQGGADASPVDTEGEADAAPDRTVSEAGGDDAASDVLGSSATDAELGDQGVASSCPASTVSCGGQCIDPRTDPAHCGATDGCGEDGGSPGQACDAGNCWARTCYPCPAGEVCCGPLGPCPPFTECILGACTVTTNGDASLDSSP